MPSAFSLSLSLSHDVSLDFPPNLNTISTQLIADYANQLGIYTIYGMRIYTDVSVSVAVVSCSVLFSGLVHN